MAVSGELNNRRVVGRVVGMERMQMVGKGFIIAIRNVDMDGFQKNYSTKAFIIINFIL